MAILLTLLGMLGWQAVGAAPAGEVLFLDLTETMPSTGTPLTKFRTFGYVVESPPRPKPGWPIRVTISMRLTIRNCRIT